MWIVENWRRVVGVSLSFWLTVAGILVLVLPEARYALTGQDNDPKVAFFASLFLLVASLGGRVFNQGISKLREWLRIIGVAVVCLLLAFVLAGQVRAAPVSEAEALEVSVPFIAQWEGKRNRAYLDIVGVPTICYGSTRGVRLGQVMRDAECLSLLRGEVAEYRAGLYRYFTSETKARRLTPERDAAYTSTAFNCGIGSIGKSTATRRLNAGNIRGGCEALTWWNKAGGRVIRGLVRRRTAEQALCLQGL